MRVPATTAARGFGASRGFTLIELMVVVVIATILLSIAIPSYMTQLRQSRRTEAKTAVLDLAGREERYFSVNPTGYTTTPANVGYATFPTYVGSNYYYVTVCSPANATCVAGLGMPNPPGTPSFTVVAYPVPGSSQVYDTQCALFAVDSNGQQWAVDNNGNNQTSYCWAN